VNETVQPSSRLPLARLLGGEASADSPWAKVTPTACRRARSWSSLPSWLARWRLWLVHAADARGRRRENRGLTSADASARTLAASRILGSRSSARILSERREGWLGYDRLTAIAKLAEVRFVRAPQYPDVDTGTVNSQADASIAPPGAAATSASMAPARRSCAISDGVNDDDTAVRRAICTGVQVLKAGSGDEGRPARIIHDLALVQRGLLWAKHRVDFANGIRALRTLAATVIVMTYPSTATVRQGGQSRCCTRSWSTAT